MDTELIQETAEKPKGEIPEKKKKGKIIRIITKGLGYAVQVAKTVFDILTIFRKK